MTDRQLETYVAGLAHKDGLGGVQDIPAEQFGTADVRETHWYRYYEQAMSGGDALEDSN